MIFQVPKSTRSLIKITARSASWSNEITIDDSHTLIVIDLPSGVSESEVEVFAQFLDGHGNVDPDLNAVVLKTKARPRRGKPHGTQQRDRSNS